jgi:hypothetical protein
MVDALESRADRQRRAIGKPRLHEHPAQLRLDRRSRKADEPVTLLGLGFAVGVGVAVAVLRIGDWAYRRRWARMSSAQKRDALARALEGRD